MQSLHGTRRSQSHEVPPTAVIRCFDKHATCRQTQLKNATTSHFYRDLGTDWPRFPMCREITQSGWFPLSGMMAPMPWWEKGQRATSSRPLASGGGAGSQVLVRTQEVHFKRLPDVRVK